MKLVTWNIQWGRGADGRVDLDRIVAHAQRFADFDVLCLQEVSAGFSELPGNDDSDQFEGIAQRLPGYQAIDGIAVDLPHPERGRKRFGNMILSRLPVGPVYRHLLTWPADPTTKTMQRIALEASIETSAGAVRVITTHLEYYSAKQRRAQVEQLRALQQDAVSHADHPGVGKPADGPFFHPERGKPAILAGDFNCRPDSDEHARLLMPFDDATPAFHDAWQVLRPGQLHPATVGLYDKAQWPDSPFTCDFIFVSEDLTARSRDIRIDQETDASDHQPVMLCLD
ncbi:endonuclease/exonuclease/phosphatase family protein [Noviherbaspirillum sp. Root189]|uniref:endonuclease/exonuclease/phosphatase family protein n=1 Tax=Noviherbaspirillum sp. Root189 TaxID=1736487 RepID=UPI00070FAE0E|nr:endonuclease/exonuclease/phosphatase family protein [Noviherbaspirillum sp. Root189]KRB73603.1 endonuclease [Noviherbaspirillum sp. Root189]